MSYGPEVRPRRSANGPPFVNHQGAIARVPATLLLPAAPLYNSEAGERPCTALHSASRWRAECEPGGGVQEDNCVFELTYNWGKEDGYSKGDAYAQVRPPPDVPPKLPH